METSQHDIELLERRGLHVAFTGRREIHFGRFQDGEPLPFEATVQRCNLFGLFLESLFIEPPAILSPLV